MLPQEIALFHSLKGAAALLLLVFMHSPQRAFLNKELKVITGYSGKTLATALDTLEALGFTRRQPAAGWRLNIGAQQLTIFDFLENTENFRPSSSSKNDPPLLTEKDPFPPPEEEENYYSADPRRKISAFLSRYDEQQQIQWIKLHAAGIGRFSTKMEEILAARLSTAFIDQHCQARHHLGDQYPVPHLITKLLNHEQPPPLTHISKTELENIIQR